MLHIEAAASPGDVGSLVSMAVVLMMMRSRTTADADMAECQAVLLADRPE